MQEDRRQYFRVTDSAYVAIKSFKNDQPSPADYFADLHQVAIINEFSQINNQLLDLLEHIKDAPVRKALGLFNEKMDLISRHLNIADINQQHLIAQSIDISEGGFSTLLTGEFHKDQQLAIALIFTPSYLSLFCKAKVTNVCQVGDKVRLHCHFLDLTEAQRQTLTRHLFKVQAQNRS